ncbi:serine/threonine protein kinase [Paenibacillus radicis (ex Xue et al. 2023)]|uniref:non-specific serine/threonine protein kinase n=1 Tax=Paenibacillus radicis (ex Xue et al. 2023) TaxID=2972489 RepID=A0ABT1YNI8_9BACL|nr:protein kinase [Paenibacillus radicis (ex Xue et al. 2023)]MCR8634749.1 protein kinase [Paenibacillus radicis (ex Xue et al. 2023)]
MSIRYIWKQLWRSLNKKTNEAVRLWDDLWFREGSIITGRYRIERKLGMGSYGVAYLCRDVRSGQRCVMKRVTPLRGGTQRAQFIYAKETGMLELLSHPAIPALYSKFRYRNHLCFTMEFMEGKSLDTLLFQEQCTFTERESLLLIRRLLPIVAYMHSVGILHRDINIANVVVEGERVKLIDLGLARELANAESVVEDVLDVEADDPSEKILRRTIHVTSDYYAVGHLLLFLLYSTYDQKEQAPAGADRGWELELTLHPGTKKLLRRLLLTEQPYVNVQDIIIDVNQILLYLKT